MADWEWQGSQQRDERGEQQLCFLLLSGRLVACHVGTTATDDNDADDFPPRCDGWYVYYCQGWWW